MTSLDLWIAVVLFFLFIFIGRAVTLWYFRINEIVDLLKEIARKL